METNYYKNKQEEGFQYQDFIYDKLGIHSYCSQKYQYEIGENRTGIEIKYDKKHAETGNLFIEIEEKKRAENENFIPSGIFCKSHTYLIGNFDKCYQFGIKYLQLLSQKKKIIEIERGTSRGYLLFPDEIDAMLREGTCLCKRNF